MARVLQPLSDAPRHAARPGSASSGDVALIRINDLRPARSVRVAGVDQDHVRLLAELDETLPPILVRHADMSVIDGMHRVAAARLRGAEMIEARFFYGSSDEAFQLAVQRNIAHGLPLSSADRQIAAEHIIRANPEFSDRFLAKTIGLAAKTIAAIRRRVLDGEPYGPRVGRDGRVRPVSTAEGRLVASRALAERPNASLREIARLAGISVGTVRDVRDRLRQGMDPIPARQRGERAAHPANARPPAEPIDIDVLLQSLRNDPSLCYTEAGRDFLRWLGVRIPREVAGLHERVPPHSGIVVAKIARECSRIWLELAEQMDNLGEDAGRR